MNLIKKIVVAGCLAAAICGCKKNSPTPEDYISYKVDGVYKSLKPEASYLDGSLLIEAGKTGGENLWIIVDGYPARGIYNLANFNVADISYGLGDDVYDSIISETGTLTIRSYDGKHISGTFEFKGSNGKTVKTITDCIFNTKVDQLGYSSPPF